MHHGLEYIEQYFHCSNPYLMFAGIVNSFLSWKLFVPLSRLTYISYLIHPVVIEVVYYAKQGPLLLTDLDVVKSFTYMCKNNLLPTLQY